MPDTPSEEVVEPTGAFPDRPEEDVLPSPSPSEVVAPDRPEQATPRSPSSLLLAETTSYTDAELIVALRARLSELEERTADLQVEILQAQERIGALTMDIRARALKAEQQYVAAIVPWARKEADDILGDAWMRAAELAAGSSTVDLNHLGNILMSYFHRQENLVTAIQEALTLK